LRVWRMPDGQLVLLAEPGECRGHAFSPNGRTLAVGQHQSVICYDLTTGQEMTRWRLPARVNTLSFHPENRTLAVGYENPGVASVYDAASGTLLTDLPVGATSKQVVAWDPDGDR